ncbi:TonB-dependent receptor [Xanthomonas translucens pv. translucens]|uniref:TonB-dependent receptor n=2 Tax=Xanthomonas campestris pv. translucens TaxID=343 RepID=A0A109HP52_XANCT|nr:TonB-dependent receptor [Xanthomonas translucens pv. translucens]KWV15912.1 TonB-dependent receptor [Xanthomonas translucens]UKE59312.1 TonB-dependent receptor [Xanthomonas translucens pv. hordei]KWV16471.1 TonB-dependent receptor [Xanthomonas translucens]MQS42372.1 TonB-dependent receptor [Xanthomonas translucens pv. translucens]
MTRRAPCKGKYPKHRNPLASVLGLAMLTPVLAWGQAKPATAAEQSAQDGAAQPASGDVKTLDSVVVTGVRESLRSAQAIKQDATQIVDSVQAQDIGKLPDANTVEALQRITGVQIQRRYGEGATDFDHRTQPAVTVRGLTQVRNFLDGRDTFSASGGRTLDLEGIPPELLSGIDVYKNPPANLIEGGVGGVVNLRTRLPFDAPGRVISGTAKGNYYDRADKTGGSASGLYSDRFNTDLGEVGVLFNVGYGRSSYRQDGILTGPFVAVPDGIIAGAPSNAQIPSGFQIYDDGGDRKRLGTAAALQWKPSDTVLVTGQFLRTTYDFYRQGKYFYQANRREAASPLAGADFTFDKNSYATSGALDNQMFESARYDQDLTSTNSNYSVNLRWNPSEKLAVTFDAQYLTSAYDADRNGFVVSLYDRASEDSSTALNRSIADFDLRGGNPRFNVRDPALLSNPNNYGFSYIADALTRNDADQLALQSDVEYFTEGGLFTKLSAGVRYADSSIDLRGTWNAACLGVDGPDRNCGTSLVYPSVSAHPEMVRKGPSPDFFDGKTLTGGVLYPEFARGSGLFDRTTRTEALFGFAPQTAFKPSDLNHQTEKTWAGYFTADYDTELAGLRLDGNIGVRLLKTTTGSDGAVFMDGGGITPLSVERTYNDVLPSFNLRAHLSDTLQARLAYSQLIARPNFDQMSTNVSLGASNQLNPITGRPGGSSGNPFLRPVQSDNYDATLEWYFAPAGSLTAGVFYKKVDGFLASGTVVRNYNGLDYDISTSLNTGNGTIRGAEFAYQQFYDFLPGWLSGLGFQFNYTYVDSSVSNPFATAGSDIPAMVPLEKLSKHSYNAVALYEKGPFTARLAWSWRGEYLDTTQGSGANGIPQYQKPYASLDASVSYNVNDHVALSFDAVNLNNRMNEVYIGTASAPLRYELNDRRYGFSARITY